MSVTFMGDRFSSAGTVRTRCWRPLPLKLSLSLRLSMHDPMLSLSPNLSMHEPLLGLGMLVVDPNHPD